ncbi:hypothetical protein [Streptomyces tremellae]|uniref:Uncharacterized protein n=1 Tax=Streptomyces tremellae TaxID=1124239 RepID=A0ABP7FK23_9ACTN
MAFGADELRVLRRALAAVLHPAQISDEDVRACLSLAESVDEAVQEAGRLRAFLLADLARYRAALPGSAAGYLELLQDALAAGYVPVPDDLAALRALRGNAVAAALLERCGRVAERSVRERLAGRPAAAAAPPAQRTRLLTLVGAASGDGKDKPGPRKPPPAKSPGERPVPKPSEVFPPRRKPAPSSPPPPPRERAAG